MKLKNKIAITFTGISACILISVFLFIWFFFSRYTTNDFYLRLKERAIISAQTFLEQDEFSTDSYNKIREKYLQKLPEETEQIYRVDIQQKKILQGQLDLPKQFIDQIFESEFAQFKQDDTYYSGLLYRDNQGDFIFIISAQDHYGINRLQSLLKILVSAFWISIVLIYVLGVYYAKFVLKPISDFTEKANDITVSNLHLRLDTASNKDELAELANTFNLMLDRLETSFDLQNQFISNASHELRNPLAAIIGQTEVSLRKDRSQDEYKESLQVIDIEAQRLDMLVDSLLKLAQTDNNEKGLIIESIRIDELLLQIQSSFAKTHINQVFQFDFSEFPSDESFLNIAGNTGLLTVAFTNVLDNASKFSNNQKVEIKLKADNTKVVLQVTDHGLGIPENDLKKITEPFYRASNATTYKGFGVGLPLTYRIIKLHRGELNISSNVGVGTQVEIILPNKNQGVKVSR